MKRARPPIFLLLFAGASFGLALYLHSLRENGIVAVHASNRHFDLVPLLAKLGRDAGLHVPASP